MRHDAKLGCLRKSRAVQTAPCCKAKKYLTNWINYDFSIITMDNSVRKAQGTTVSRGEARPRILAAAIEAFASHGFQAVGPRHVSELAGLNHSLVTYHFGSMDDLWKEAVSSLFEAFRAHLIQRFQGLDGLNAETRLSIAIEDLVAHARENPALHQIMLHEGRAMNPRLEWLVESQLRPMFRMTKAMIEEGQRGGRVRDFDPDLLYYAMIALAATPFSLKAEFGAVTGRNPDDLSRQIIAMIRCLIFVGDEDKKV